METHILRSIGLTEREISIYLALLRLTTATAARLATETNTDRATTYRFLSSLIDRGLVSSYTTNNVKHFKAAPPSRLAEDLQEKLASVEEVIPELERLMAASEEESNVEMFKGKEGLKTIMKDIIREGKPYTFIGEVEKFFTEMSFYVEQWLREVEKRKIKGRLICDEKSRFKVARTETYRLIRRDFLSKISTWTYEKKTALFIWSTPPFGILIENSAVMESNRSLFDFLWSLGKEPSARHVAATRRARGRGI